MPPPHPSAAAAALEAEIAAAVEVIAAARAAAAAAEAAAATAALGGVGGAQGLALRSPPPRALIPGLLSLAERGAGGGASAGRPRARAHSLDMPTPPPQAPPPPAAAAAPASRRGEWARPGSVLSRGELEELGLGGGAAGAGRAAAASPLAARTAELLRATARASVWSSPGAGGHEAREAGGLAEPRARGEGEADDIAQLHAAAAAAAERAFALSPLFLEAAEAGAAEAGPAEAGAAEAGAAEAGARSPRVAEAAG